MDAVKEALLERKIDDLGLRLDEFESRNEAEHTAIRDEICALRTEVREDLGAVRSEMTRQGEELRTELGAEMRTLRGEMNDRFRELGDKTMELNRLALRILATLAATIVAALVLTTLAQLS